MSEDRPKYIDEALEMIGIDLEAPKQIIQEVSGFTPLFDAVVQQYKDETRAAVHGAMWRFCQMEDGVCRASLSTIAEMLGISPATVMRHAEALCRDGYFTDLTPDLKNRPHVYADAGRVVMKSKLNAHVSQRNTGISQRNAGISESQLSKVLNKDSNKKPEITLEQLDFLKKAGLEWLLLKPDVSIDEIEEAIKSYSIKDTATKAFEAALGFSKPLPWWQGKEWTEFGEWVCQEYTRSKTSFGDYNIWRNTPYTKGGMANPRIRSFVNEFSDSWDMFLMSIPKPKNDSDWQDRSHAL